MLTLHYAQINENFFVILGSTIVSASGMLSVGTLTTLTVNGNFVLKDGTNDIDIASHDGDKNGLKLGGTLIKSTASELNILDGIASTLSATEINYLKDISTGSGTKTIQTGKAVVYSSTGEIFSSTIEISKEDTDDNTVSRLLSLVRKTNSTSTNGIGVGISLNVESKKTSEEWLSQ
eukprot:g4253.t1